MSHVNSASHLNRTAGPITPNAAATSHDGLSGLNFWVHSYQTIARSAGQAGATVQSRPSKATDVMILGGHHFGRYKNQSGKFVRGGRVWWLHKQIRPAILRAVKSISISGCSALNMQSMEYYTKHCPAAIVLGSGMGVDPKTRAGRLIQAFWAWVPSQGHIDLDSVQGRLHFKSKFEHFVETYAGKHPREVEGFGWFDASTGTRRIFMVDKHSGRGHWVTKDYSKHLH